MSLFTPNITVSNPIPPEVKIYYSKYFAVISILFLCVFVGIGIFWFAIGHVLLGTIVCLVPLCLIVVKARWLVNNKPQVIINTAGIQTANTPFYDWAKISDERVSGEYTGRGARPTLDYTHPKGKEKVMIEPLNIRPQDLDILLKYYRKHWEFRNV
ncbi:hypothetical protein ABIB62_003913 [Mucilaginibacter sp. UYP25]|uniref:hypothetical protein n=1 Tax=unclassified Mucilaginibacter TaxID=2617802 RepID=UPI00339A5677